MFTLEQIFKKDRTETPYLMGDVFTKGDIEFTIVDMRYDGGLVGFTRKGKDLYISFFQSVDELMAQGYAPVLENIELCKEYAKEEIFALRRLKDGTIAGISPLMSTTALMVDIGPITPFESRYCFQRNSEFPSYTTALYWLCLLDSAESCPIGNVAYRGHIGTDPIMDQDVTREYFAKMYLLRHQPTIGGKDMREIAMQTMNEIFYSLAQKSNQVGFE